MGLRERQRALTEETIRAAAVRLFREKGSAATTVEEIAELAGVSARTFFRYFDTKESAALPSVAPFEEALEYFSPAGTSVRQLLAAVDELIADLMDHVAVHDLHTSREFLLLLEKDLAVRDMAGVHAARAGHVLLKALHETAPGADLLTLRLIASNRISTVQAVWLHWHWTVGQLGGDIDAVDAPAAIYRRAVEQLRRW